MASSKVSYVAFGEDDSLGFDGDDVLNRSSSRSFDEPPWRVIDSDVEFKPMFVDGHEPDGDHATEHVTFESSDDSTINGTETALDHPSLSSDVDGDSEWAEVEILAPEFIEISEDEVDARIEEAVAKVKNEMTTVHSEEIKALKDALKDLRQEHNEKCEEIREATTAECEEKLHTTLEGYRDLTAKIKHSSSRVSEFFEPLSRLSVHIANQLVRGELNVGPVAITRLVQGCLDAVEDKLSKNDPVLRMHPDDLTMFLSNFNREPEGVKCIGDDSLARGDVSLQIDSSVIDDLISHRLEEITSRIFGGQHEFSDQLFRKPLTELNKEQIGLIDNLSSEFLDTESNNSSDLTTEDTVESGVDEQTVSDLTTEDTVESGVDEQTASDLTTEDTVESGIDEQTASDLTTEDTVESEVDEQTASDLTTEDTVESGVDEQTVSDLTTEDTVESGIDEQTASDLTTEDTVESEVDERTEASEENINLKHQTQDVDSIKDVDQKRIEDDAADSVVKNGA